MIDLTNALTNITTDSHPMSSEQSQQEAWTHERIRAFLNRHRIVYRVTERRDRNRDGDVQYDLTACPLCKHTEGNPAVWLQGGVPCFKCFWEPGCDEPPKATFADLQSHFECLKAKRLNGYDLLSGPDTPPKLIVSGLLCDSDVGAIVGGPKTRKSFFVLQLSLSVAAGIPFLGLPTGRGRVRIYDNELRVNDLRRRLRSMMKAMGLDPSTAKEIEIVPLRGELADLKRIRDDCDSSELALIVIDALYKTLPKGTDENSNSDMTRTFLLLDSIAERAQCGVLIVHHTSKGSQAGKSVSDMGAGAGAQSRSADAHIVLREHEDEGFFVLQAVLRNQRPFDPICLTFDYPLWHHSTDKDPNRLASGDKKPSVTLEMFLETIPVEPARKTEVLAFSKQVLGVTEKQLSALLYEATTSGTLEIDKPQNRTLPHTIRRKCAA